MQPVGRKEAAINTDDNTGAVCAVIGHATGRDMSHPDSKDINFEERTVLIPKRKDPRNKESNDQIVPLVGASMEIIIEQIGTRTKGRIFPYNSRSASASFTRACKALKIEDLHFHDLRHAATVELFRMGLDIPRVAMITGHKSWVNLRRYTNLTAEDVHNVIS